MSAEELRAFANFILAVARTTPSDSEALTLIQSRLTEKFKEERETICEAILQLNAWDNVARTTKFTKQDIIQAIRALP